MLRKGNVLDCVDRRHVRLAGTTRPGYNNPAAQGNPYPLALSKIIGAFVTAISVIIAVRPLLGFLSGWGLLKYKPWARIVGFVLSALNRLRVASHTALGMYVLWVLSYKQTERLFLSPPAVS